MARKNSAMKIALSLSLPALLLVSCAGPVSENRMANATIATAPATASATGTRFASPPNERPGLGTKWGETRRSNSGTTTFVRATPNDPLAIAEIFYNDREGIEAMASEVQFSRTWPVLRGPVAQLVSIAVCDESGRLLPGLRVGERWFVIGEAGRRYAIHVRNESNYRLEVVLSVDGLDVLDGRSASVRKRGYAIEPHRTLVVDGFRQSTDAVAAFRFSSMNESYAHQKYHNSKNVGVIGAAIFNEAGTFPWKKPEVEKRLRANPFPNPFATPP
jgi:hypothetical protein